MLSGVEHEKSIITSGQGNATFTYQWPTHYTVTCHLVYNKTVNSYGHGGKVSSPNHGKLEQAVNQYFVHIRSHVTDNNPS